MMFNMISAVVEIVSSEATRQVVDNVVDFSSRMLTDFCRGRSLVSVSFPRFVHRCRKCKFHETHCAFFARELLSEARARCDSED